MFGENDHDSIIQQGIDEALACQDMLARAPVKPSLFTRALTRLLAVLPVGVPWTRQRPPHTTPATPLEISR